MQVAGSKSDLGMMCGQLPMPKPMLITCTNQEKGGLVKLKVKLSGQILPAENSKQFVWNSF